MNMAILSLLLMFLFQAPQTVVVGLDDGMKVTMDTPDFSGFIEGRGSDAVLLYREKTFHGEMPVKTISIS